MFGTSYTRCGMLCEGLSSQNVDGEYVLCNFLRDERTSHDTNIQFSFVVPWLSISGYSGILNDGFDRPNNLFLRLSFVVV